MIRLRHTLRYTRALVLGLAAALAGCLPNEVAVSRDGRLAFRTAENLVVTEPYKAGSASVKAVRIGRECRSPSFSPDGARLAFVAELGKEEREAQAGAHGVDIDSAILVCRADGSDRRTVAFGRKIMRAAWSPDGRSIAYTTDEDMGREGPHGLPLRQLDLGSGRKDRLGEVVSWFFAWSPDSGSVAAVAGDGAKIKDSLLFGELALLRPGEPPSILGSVVTDGLAPVRFAGVGAVECLAYRIDLPSAARFEDLVQERAVLTAPLPGSSGARVTPVRPRTIWMTPSPDGKLVVELDAAAAPASSEPVRHGELRVRPVGAPPTGPGAVRVSEVSHDLLPTWIAPQEVLFQRHGKLFVLDADSGKERPLEIELPDPGARVATAGPFVGGAVRIEGAKLFQHAAAPGAEKGATSGEGTDATIEIRPRSGPALQLRSSRIRWEGAPDGGLRIQADGGVAIAGGVETKFEGAELETSTDRVVVRLRGAQQAGPGFTQTAGELRYEIQPR